MADDMKTEFRRALDDLNEGIEALFGLRDSKADLVGELLAEDEVAGRRSRPTPRPRSHPRRVRPRQRRRSAGRHLSLVE